MKFPVTIALIETEIKDLLQVADHVRGRIRVLERQSIPQSADPVFATRRIRARQEELAALERDLAELRTAKLLLEMTED